MQEDTNEGTRWLYKGIELANSERFEAAIECFDEALMQDPKYDGAWFHRGEALAATLRFEEALECYRKATELDHEYAAAWYGQGIALVGLDRFEEAIRCFDEAIRIDPHLDAAREDRAQALKDLGDVSGIASITSNRPYRGTNSAMSSQEKSGPPIRTDEGKKATLEQPIPTNKEQRHMVILKCMVCNLPLRFSESLLWCPYCGTLAHRTHLLEWVHVKKNCPSCGHQLDEEYFAGSS